MKCPLCNVDMRITSNTLVRRADGTYAHRLRLSCPSPQCENYKMVVKTEYIPVDVVDEGEEPA